jgi:hypothetical protein
MNRALSVGSLPVCVARAQAARMAACDCPSLLMNSVSLITAARRIHSASCIRIPVASCQPCGVDAHLRARRLGWVRVAATAKPRAVVMVAKAVDRGDVLAADPVVGGIGATAKIAGRVVGPLLHVANHVKDLQGP